MKTRTTRRPALRLEALEERWVPVNPVNNLPGTQTVVEDNQLVFSAANGNEVSVSDADGPGPFEVELNSFDGTAAVASTAGLTVTGNGTAAVRLIGSLADVNAALSNITFTPTPNFEGAAILQVESDDQDGAGGLTDTDNLNITVTPNQNPRNNLPGTQTTPPDTPLVFSAANGNQVSVSDADGPGPFEVELNSSNGTAAVTAAGGAAVTGNGTATVQIIGTLADVNATLAVITFTPTGGFIGTAILQVESDDLNGTGGRSDTDNINVTVAEPSSISGAIFDDLNGNGVVSGDPGQGGVTVQLIRDNNNDSFNNDAVFATTNTAAGTGAYSFSDLGPGRYFIQQVVPAGTIQTFGPASYTVVATSGTDVIDQNFGNFSLVAISGSVFEDLDGDGVRDGGEPGLAGVTVNLDIGANGTTDSAATTSGSGGFAFANLGPGTYRVRVVLPPDTIQTTTNPSDITATSGVGVSNADFGIADGEADLAVAITDNSTTAVPNSPLTYTITLTNNGPAVVTEVSLLAELSADFLPAGDLPAHTFTPLSGIYDPVTQIWSGLSLASGQSATLVVSGIVSPAASGALTATVTVSPVPSVIDPIATNNTAADTTTVTALSPPPGGPKVDLFAVGSGPGIEATVEVFNADGTLRFTLKPYTGFTGGVTVATGDVTGDGIDDIATGAGQGGAPHVKVFDGATGAEIRSFFAYDHSLRSGVFVGLGDVTGDGRADIVTGAGFTGAPHVKAFDGQTLATVHSFFAFSHEFRGGVTVRAGDVDGDGRADIVTGAGPGAAPHIKVFSGRDLSLLQSFFAGDPTETNGVFVGVANLSGDARTEVVAGLAGRVKAFGNVQIENPYIEQDNLVSFGPGVRTSVAAVRQPNGIIAVLQGAAPGSGAAPHVKILDGNSNTVVQSFFAFDPAFTGGVFVG